MSWLCMKLWSYYNVILSKESSIEYSIVLPIRRLTIWHQFESNLWIVHRTVYCLSRQTDLANNFSFRSYTWRKHSQNTSHVTSMQHLSPFAQCVGSYGLVSIRNNTKNDNTKTLKYNLWCLQNKTKTSLSLSACEMYSAYKPQHKSGRAKVDGFRETHART